MLETELLPLRVRALLKKKTAGVESSALAMTRGRGRLVPTRPKEPVVGRVAPQPWRADAHRWPEWPEARPSSGCRW